MMSGAKRAILAPLQEPRRAVMACVNFPKHWSAFQKRGYIISHNMWGVNAWDSFLMLMIVYIAFYAPLVLAFPDEVEWHINTSINHYTMSNAMDIVFLLDVLIKARTSFMDHGYEVTDPQMIWLRYLRTFFFVDLISAIPLGFFFTNRYVQIVTLIRLMRIWRLIRKLENLSGANTMRSKLRPASATFPFAVLPAAAIHS